MPATRCNLCSRQYSAKAPTTGLSDGQVRAEPYDCEVPARPPTEYSDAGMSGLRSIWIPVQPVDLENDRSRFPHLLGSPSKSAPERWAVLSKLRCAVKVATSIAAIGVRNG